MLRSPSMPLPRRHLRCQTLNISSSRKEFLARRPLEANFILACNGSTVHASIPLFVLWPAIPVRTCFLLVTCWTLPSSLAATSSLFWYECCSARLSTSQKMHCCYLPVLDFVKHDRMMQFFPIGLGETNNIYLLRSWLKFHGASNQTFKTLRPQSKLFKDHWPSALFTEHSVFPVQQSLAFLN